MRGVRTGNENGRVDTSTLPFLFLTPAFSVSSLYQSPSGSGRS